MRRYLLQKNMLIMSFWVIGRLIGFAQYSNVSVEKFPAQMNVVHVDYRDSSTLVFVSYTSQKGVKYCTINDRACIQIKNNNKKYRLIHSINLPINSEAEKNYMLFDSVGQKHNFVLEFEKIPTAQVFDVIESEKDPNSLNFYGVSVDTLKRDGFKDINNFVSSTPVKETGSYIKDGNTVYYINSNNVIVSISVHVISQYGKYFNVNVDVKNFSGKSILFSLSHVKAEGYFYIGDVVYETYPLKVLTSTEYDKKVSSRQTLNNVLLAVGEGLSAASASYSRSATSYTANSHTVGGLYGNAYTSTYGYANTVTYNSAAAYVAQQNACAICSNYANGQNAIRQQLNDGYAKDNTIQNQTEYSGSFNIKYKQSDHFKIVFTIDDVQYPFMF
jgi:hypothetical protein